MKHWQGVISRWVRSTFGDEHQDSTLERSSRFFEEAAELCQAVGLRQELAQEIFDKVYSNPVGRVHQEFGGALITILALAENQEEDALKCLIDESDRIHRPDIIEKCRARQQEKKSQGLGI